jgi:hypothetical protein
MNKHEQEPKTANKNVNGTSESTLGKNRTGTTPELHET